MIDSLSGINDYIRANSIEQLEQVIAEAVKKEVGFTGEVACTIEELSFNASGSGIKLSILDALPSDTAWIDTLDDEDLDLAGFGENLMKEKKS